jgi:hypothetical protein
MGNGHVDQGSARRASTFFSRGMVAVTGNGHMDQGSARRAEAHRESGNRDSCGHKHHVIESARIRDE